MSYTSMNQAFVFVDTLRYVGLVLAWTFAGRAILAGAGQRALGTAGWLLAPAAAQACIAIVLAMSAVLGVPIRTVSAPLWAALAIGAALGIAIEAGERQSRSAPRCTRGEWLAIATAMIAPVLLMLPCFVHGLGAAQGTTHPDAWSYTVFSAYLHEYPRFTQGGLSPAFQWAANLSGTRFVSPAELAWFAPVTGEGDTAAAYGLLVAHSAFVFACASTAAARALGVPSYLLWIVAAGAGAGNWLANALEVSNLDNLSALAYMPALVALAADTSPMSRTGRAALCGVVVAATIYTYPEFAPVILGCSALSFVHPVVTRRLLVRDVLIGAAVAVLASLPYLPELWRFFEQQFAAGVRGGIRPGEGMFAGLLLPLVRPAGIWGLGPEDAAHVVWWPETLAGLALFALAARGLWQLAASRALAPIATLGILMIGFGVFEYRNEYSYGAYKFVLLSWWLMLVAVALGVAACLRFHRVAGMVAACIALATSATAVAESVRAASMPPNPDMPAYRALAALEPVRSGTPVAIAVADNTAAQWAVYFLRDAHTKVVAFSGYLAAAPFKALVERSTPIAWNDLRLLLTDASDPGPVVESQPGQQVWRNGRYTLWDTRSSGWAVVWQVDNGYPWAPNDHIVWIGDKPVTIVATASGRGVATFHAGLSISQPLPETAPPIRLRAPERAGAGCEWGGTPQGFTLTLELQEGVNTLVLEKTSPTGIAVLPTADQRHPFMVALDRPTMAFNSGTAEPATYCR